MFRLKLHAGQNVSEGFQKHVCFPQAEGILRGWATPALQKDYGSDPVVTKIWNTTMAEVQYLSSPTLCHAVLNLRDMLV